MKKLWAVCLALALIWGIFPSIKAVATQARVTRCNLRLREKNSTESETLVTIPGGTEVTVLGVSGGWTKTEYNGHTGYISTNYLMDMTKSGYYPLKERDENQYVRQLQEALTRMGYMNTAATGKYEEDTSLAVRNFQKENGIKQDGMAGGETQKVLFGDFARGYSGSVAAVSNNAEAVVSTAAGKASSDTLRLGSSGSEVRELQTRLIELGYLAGKADGDFGKLTEKAVIAFQRKVKVRADGKAGEDTQTLLYSSNAPDANGQVARTSNDAALGAGSTKYTPLKQGMTSSDVEALQDKLKQLGYLAANSTGFYGSATYAAVIAFQENNGLKADGVAGGETQRTLYGDSAKASNNSSSTESGKIYSTLKEGMRSSDVTSMQEKLKQYGYMSANATGYFGSATLKAVKTFQENNGLKADGVAGSSTLSALYGSATVASGGSSSGNGLGKISGPSSSSVKLLHWNNTVRPSLKYGNSLLIYDPSSNYSWNLTATSLGRHLEAEPNTTQDTEIMNQAFGNSTTWNPKPVYVKLPSGTWTMATMHNTPHLSGKIKDNNFDGHLCVHFLRDMAEAKKKRSEVWGPESRGTTRGMGKAYRPDCKLSGRLQICFRIKGRSNPAFLYLKSCSIRV